MGRHLNYMSTNSSAFQKIKEKFDNGWQHYGKTGTMGSLYLYDDRWTAEGLSKYKIVFHGTKRACNLGEAFYTSKCGSRKCSLCSILRKERFDVKKASKGGMFGPGVYTSPISSKADFYAKNVANGSDVNVLILCLTDYEKPQHLYSADHRRKKTDPGYDVVEAVTKDNGGSVIYPELVAYNNYTFFPVGIVVYRRN